MAMVTARPSYKVFCVLVLLLFCLFVYVFCFVVVVLLFAGQEKMSKFQVRISEHS